MRVRLLSMVGLVVGFGIAGVAGAADPVKVGPDVYSVQLENEKVRVSEIAFHPGQSIAMHSHPDHFLYVLQAGTLKLTKADGTTADFAGEVGQLVWIPAEAHAAVNTGTTAFKALVVELKPLPND